MASNADASLRLDRLLTTLAIGSRSQVKDIIRAGRVCVNSAPVTKADLHIAPGDSLTIDGRVLDARIHRHVMLHKPCGVLTAARDQKQPTVLDLLPPVYASCGCMPIGRLDKDTSGLLLLSTDGDLAHRLLSPRRHVWKCYEATVDGPLNREDEEAFSAGLTLSDFTALPARLEILSSCVSSATARTYVREGKFHQVRRMFAARGCTVLTLKRLSFGPLALDPALAPGEYRELTDEELRLLHQAVSGDCQTNE